MPAISRRKIADETVPPARQQATPIGSEFRIHVGILLASPVLIFILNRNWTFQGFGDYDSFYYFGHFIHFPHYQGLRPTYAGERLPWILPGYVLVHLLTPVYGTLALHFLAYYAAALSLYSIVRTFSTGQAAFLAAGTLAFHPYFLAANGIDYLVGGLIAFCLLTFAFLVRSVFAADWRGWLWLSAAGCSWAAVVYSYPFWLTFTPACVAVYLAADQARGASSPNWRPRLTRMAVPASLFAAGFLALTLALMLAHRLIFGEGGFDFQRISLGAMRAAGQMTENPWASKSFSVTYADWLVFPGVGAALALLISIPSFRRWFGTPAGSGTLCWMYLYFAAVMVVMTIRVTRLLEFDYFASFLMPGIFIVFGVSIFNFSARAIKPWFWFVFAAACAISIAPLVKPGLYIKPPILGAVAPGMLLGAGVAIRLLRPRSLLAMIVAILGVAASSFCLEPAVGGIAWRGQGDWLHATRRVADTVRTIEARLPRDKYPVFWFDEAAPHGLEFQAIMCAFLSHGESMRNFPEVDPGRKYVPGQILVLLTEQPGAFDSASRILAQSGMRLVFLWEQRVESAGVAYSITATEVRVTP